jgi:hypothetical protein
MVPLLQVLAAGVHDINPPALAVRGQFNDLPPYSYEAAASVASASPYVSFVPTGAGIRASWGLVDGLDFLLGAQSRSSGLSLTGDRKTLSNRL